MDLSAQSAYFGTILGGRALSNEIAHDEVTIIVARENIVEVLSCATTQNACSRS